MGRNGSFQVHDYPRGGHSRLGGSRKLSRWREPGEAGEAGVGCYKARAVQACGPRISVVICGTLGGTFNLACLEDCGDTSGEMGRA